MVRWWFAALDSNASNPPAPGGIFSQVLGIVLAGVTPWATWEECRLLLVSVWNFFCYVLFFFLAE